MINFFIMSLIQLCFMQKHVDGKRIHIYVYNELNNPLNFVSGPQNFEKWKKTRILNLTEPENHTQDMNK